MAYLPQSATIDPSQFQNPRYINGVPRNASPGFPNPMYQVGAVVPSKRPREREDSHGASPRPAPGGLPGSRSQTPAQNPYPGFHGAPNGNPHFAQPPTPYQHLQGPASNASGSPVPQNQHFNPANNIQRVQTASPSPFSPHGGPQMSPALPDHPSRGSTPHDIAPGGFMPNNQFAPGINHASFPQAMAAQPNQMPSAPPFNPMAPSMGPRVMTPQQQQHYQMQLQSHARQMQAASNAQSVQPRPPSAGMPPSASMPNPQVQPVPGIPNQNRVSPQDQERFFIKTIQQQLVARGLPLEINPIILGRQISTFQLYHIVARSGGSARTSQSGRWTSIASSFGFQPQHLQQAARDLEGYFRRILAGYEMLLQQRQQNKDAIPRGPVLGPGVGPRPDMPGQAPPQMSPERQVNAHNNQGPPSEPPKTPLNDHLNGFAPPLQAKEQSQNQTPHRPSISRPVDGSQPNGIPAPHPIPSPNKRPESDAGKAQVKTEEASHLPVRHLIEDPFKPEILLESRYHGPIIIDDLFSISSGIIDLKPTAPRFQELGLIDIHSLTMSLKSGIHAEVRMALDTLTTVSADVAQQLMLEQCEDLVEALIECGHSQLDLLVEHAAEVSNEILVDSYEDVVRACKQETDRLQDVPEVGSLEYNLDRAVDRLVCVTTILRNLSFFETNFNLLGTPEVIKLLNRVIRNIGTRSAFLRSPSNVLDFMKDVICFLSNLSQALHLPSKEDALGILYFLLSFAPGPPPTQTLPGRITFTPYNPNVHKYLPSAVDTLAKVLARDDPNRAFFKSIFTASATSSPPFELLTHTFGLAISTIPDGSKALTAIVDARKPTLLQGMLSAEILTSLIPSNDHGLAHSWLESADGFAVSLQRLVPILNAHQRSFAGRQGQEKDPDYLSITHHGLEVLKRLAEKSKASEGGNGKIPYRMQMKKESVLGAMMVSNIDPDVLRQLCIYSDMND
ncbi:MAG: hypothetical protein Q9160_001185 [Pyrenula sp. 1 TL-2023]